MLLVRVAMVLVCIVGAAADAPDFRSAFNITVGNWRWISVNRTIEVDISTPVIHPATINGPHRVRVTFPNDYFTTGSGRRYPALYLLHGGAGGNSAQWTTGGGAVEPITNNRPLIVVMPDGGKVGWFTDWVNPGNYPQEWAHFLLDQMIPFIDFNIRTHAAKSGRAVAGLSMGGYGAVRLAQDRPDLFTFVGSYSGAVDLGDAGTRTVVTEQCIQNLLPADGPFGNPFWPFDTVWNKYNPMNRAETWRGQGMTIAMYAGAGSWDGDIIEGTMRASADRFKGVLDRAGIPAFYWMYGRPGPNTPFKCDGGHNFGCWNYAFQDSIPRMLAVLN